MATATTEQRATAIRDKLLEDDALADQILLKRVPSIPNFTRTDDEFYQPFFDPDEWMVLREIIKKPRTIPGECTRIAGVFKFSGIAGTAKDRADADATFDAADKALRKQGPQLEAKILAAETKLSELGSAVAAARDEVTRRKTALGNLRRFAPFSVKELHNRRTKELKSERGHSPLTADDEAELNGILDFYANGLNR